MSTDPADENQETSRRLWNVWLGSLHCSWQLLEIGAPPPAVQLAQTSKVEI